MQYPVPQFTDVEDRIIGSLTIKQFGIIFAAGIIVFLIYSMFKSIPVLIVAAIFVGLPALAVAFAKVNGRPMYRFFGHFIKFFTEPKFYVFHKEARTMSDLTKLKDAEISQKIIFEEKPKGDTKTRIAEINRLLEQKAQEERELVNNIR